MQSGVHSGCLSRVRAAALSLCFLSLCFPVSAAAEAADTAATDNTHFVWEAPGGSVVSMPNGAFEARGEGGRTVAWRLDPGERAVDPAGIETREDGGARIERGRLARGGNALAVSYVQELRAENEALQVRYTLTKTGGDASTATALTMTLPFDVFQGTRLFLRPGRPVRFPGHVRAVSDGCLVEIADGRALDIQFDGFHLMTLSAQDAASAALRIDLLPDTGAGQTVSAAMTLRFTEMPARLPGEITPSTEALTLRGATPNRTQVPRYGLFELDVDLAATCDNPFDPGQVALDARFVAPSGRSITVPGFYMVDFAAQTLPAGQVLHPGGTQGWRVRFTPAETGIYHYELTARDSSGTTTGAAGSFEAAPSENPGFIRTSSRDPHYFAFDNGTSYFPIGHNLPSYAITGQTAEQALRTMAAAGENYNRPWMSSYTGLGIEWEHALGWYRQDEAWRVDEMLRLGQELGMYFMLCMDTHQDFREGRLWTINPYNVARGGPCETPADWFSNPAARAAYRNRMRYTVARWGFSPHILAWELGNEFEGWPDTPREHLAAWHEEMSAWLTAADPFGHLVTTSFWSKTGPPEFWHMPNIGIAQTHCYTNNDYGVGPVLGGYCAHQAAHYRKPNLLAEFGIRSHESTSDKDPEGWHLHNALWAGVMSGCAGAPMPWWHENYIEPLNLYFHFTSVGRFVAGLAMDQARWRPLEAPSIAYAPEQFESVRKDVELVPQFHWGTPPVNEFAVADDGTVNDMDMLPRLLQGRAHAELRNPPVFTVHYPEDGRFLVHVGAVSNAGRLRIRLDGEVALEKPLPCAEGLGKKSIWREQWKLWETTYDESFGIDVPKGSHRIQVDNDEGVDWIHVERYIFTGCQTRSMEPLLVYGMQNDASALIWLQHRDSTWLAHAGNQAPAPTKPATLTLPGFKPGEYAVEWWETWNAALTHQETATAGANGLKLALPPIATDVALKIHPVQPGP